MRYKNKNRFTPAFENVEGVDRCVMNSCNGCCIEGFQSLCGGQNKHWTEEHPEVKLIDPSEIEDYWTNYGKTKGIKAGKESTIAYIVKLLRAAVGKLFWMITIVVLLVCVVFVCVGWITCKCSIWSTRQRVSKCKVSGEVSKLNS